MPTLRSDPKRPSTLAVHSPLSFRPSQANIYFKVSDTLNPWTFFPILNMFFSNFQRVFLPILNVFFPILNVFFPILDMFFSILNSQALFSNSRTLFFISTTFFPLWLAIRGTYCKCFPHLCELFAASESRIQKCRSYMPGACIETLQFCGLPAENDELRS